MAGTITIRYPGSPRRSRVIVRAGALAGLGEAVRTGSRPARAALVTDTNVAALWADAALRSLRRAGIAAETVVVPAGERSKSVRHLARLWSHLAALDLDRSDAIVALGGGVVGDLAGFAAATWLRGVDWYCVPTSLLAQVDASVGGKTAIDLPEGKNLAGCFHQPRAVLADPLTLATLPRRHLRAGLAEVVKTGMAVDAALFSWLEANAGALGAGEPAALERAVGRCVRAKAGVVAADEREREGGRRAALNYGHTLGHALEACLGYRRLLHGEAVAVGMRAAGSLSAALAGLSRSDLRRQDGLLDGFGLRARVPGLPVEALLDAMRRDKKRRNGRIRWVLTSRVGHASVPRLIEGRRVAAALVEVGARP